MFFERPMFAYEELKERIPESEEEMTGNEALNYFKAKTKRKEGLGWYSLAVKDIHIRTEFCRGSVLDVGCGGGGLLREFQNTNQGLNLIGVDASRTLLNAARKISEIKLGYSRAEKLKFKNESFELVVCQDTFHHFRKPIEVLKEMYRVTKKGGYVYITDLRRDADKSLIENAIKNISRGSISHCIFYMESLKAAYVSNEIERLLHLSGIKKYKLLNGKCSDSIQTMINEVEDIERRKDLDRLFKERWVAVIKKE